MVLGESSDTETLANLYPQSQKKTAFEVKEVKVETWDLIMSLCPQHQ